MPQGWPYSRPPTPWFSAAGRGELTDMAAAVITRFRAGGYRAGVPHASGTLDDLCWQLEEISWMVSRSDPVAGERSLAVWGELEMINAMNLDNGAEATVDRAELDELLDTYLSILHTDPA